MKNIILFVMILTLGCASTSFADQESFNQVHVKSSEYGSHYAKSIPKEMDGFEGQTFVYEVKEGQDELKYTYDWFSKEVYLSQKYLVRMGPWAQGHEPDNQTLAIAFYKDGEFLNKYSTLEIAEKCYENVVNISRSVSHYSVFKDILGYRWLMLNDEFVFEVLTFEDKVLMFNVETGRLLTESDKEILRIKEKIGEIKRSWFSKNEKSLEDEYSYNVLEKELRDFAGDEFPKIPEGYKLVIGGYFDFVQLKKVD